VYAHAFDKRLEGFEDRVKMCELAFADLRRVEVSRIESRLERPSRTLATLEALAQSLPGVQLRLVIGSDLSSESERWHRFDEIKRIAPPLVIGRAGHEPPKSGVELPPVSSTHVRELLATGGPDAERELELLVPRAVLDYVRREGLYHSSSTSGKPSNGP
jgi:nicotinate-nucleotide adenylyltransferase